MTVIMGTKGRGFLLAAGVLGSILFGAGPVLVFQIFHSAASHVLDAAPDDAARWVLDLLADAIGRSLFR